MDNYGDDYDVTKNMISSILRSPINGEYSFVIMGDCSKDGWEMSESFKVFRYKWAEKHISTVKNILIVDFGEGDTPAYVEDMTRLYAEECTFIGTAGEEILTNATVEFHCQPPIKEVPRITVKDILTLIPPFAVIYCDKNVYDYKEGLFSNAKIRRVKGLFFHLTISDDEA